MFAAILVGGMMLHRYRGAWNFIRSNTIACVSLILTPVLFFYPAAAARNASNGQSLTDEWVKNTTYKENKKREDDERNAKVCICFVVVLSC